MIRTAHLSLESDFYPESDPSTPELTSDSSTDDELESSLELTTTPPSSKELATRSLNNLFSHLKITPDLDVEKASLVRQSQQHKQRQTRSIENDTKTSLSHDLRGSKELNRVGFRRRSNNNASDRAGQISRSRDRFIPLRHFTDCPSTPLHVGKHHHELSPEEKLLRHRPLRDDPFMPTRTRRSMSGPSVPSHLPYFGPHFVNDLSIAGACPHGPRDLLRRVSGGAIWNVGGSSAALGRRPVAVPGGVGGLLASGTTAPMYTARFLPQTATIEQREKHKARIAVALDIDPAERILRRSKLWPLLETLPSPTSLSYERLAPIVWKDHAWKRAERDQWTPGGLNGDRKRSVPSRPFRILDAPNLRDDFYCTTLAYCPTSGILAVGLGHHVYVWSEALGVQYPPFDDHHPSNYVMSLAFSSENGCKSILAVGRHSGLLSLWSTSDREVRFQINHPVTVTCLAFKPTKTRRLSERFRNTEVDTEELAVGDDSGFVWYYSVEWPDDDIEEEFDWPGTMTLLAKISAHTQQVCGIAWSPDSTYLATGGNDNSCLVFDLRDILPHREASESTQRQNAASCSSENLQMRPYSEKPHSKFSPLSNESMASTLLNYAGCLLSGPDRTIIVPPNHHKHRLAHSAAVKAIAFAPWQPSLLATGGGSNDRAIHFYHTPSGACLATINVYAQVTGLIWNNTRREIVATFGFAQPEHPFRIAVFAWPTCEQIAAIPWGPHGSTWDSSTENETLADCGRALCAVSYPGRASFYTLRNFQEEDSSSSSSSTLLGRWRRRQSEPPYQGQGREAIRPRAKEGGLWCSRTRREGCIIVASSDQSVKFHEVWTSSRRSTLEGSGAYGGSGILEGLEGLERPGKEIIR